MTTPEQEPTRADTEAAERATLLARLDGLVRSESIKQRAASGSLAYLRDLVVDLEETDALNKKYGRLQAEASPEGW